MKSRLLPSSDQDHDSVADAAPVVDQPGAEQPIAELLRRESDMVDTFDEVAEAVAHATVAEPMAANAPTTSTPTTSRQTPQVSARPNGRYVAVAILLVSIGSVSYSLWSTFLRDVAYGVVAGKITKISAPWPGSLTAVYARAGDQVKHGEILAVVDDPDLRADIDRLGDELRTAQAELDAQTAQLALAARQRNDEADEVRANYFDLRGELLAKQARHAELTSKLKRRREMAHKQAYSDEEIESLTFVAQGLAAKIENLQQAIAALESRLQDTTASEFTAQLKPWLSQIEFTQAEIMRLRDKQGRGTIRAPFNGTVVAVTGHVGEHVDEQPILELLPDDSLEFVLYVKQADIDSYPRGRQVGIVIEPKTEAITCEVAHIGQRLEQPAAHVVGRYRPEEKLIPVYLNPLNAPSGTELRVGSTLRQPLTLLDSD